MAVAETRALRAYCSDVARRAKAASVELARISGQQKIDWLLHSANELRQQTDRLVKANGGRIVAVGTTSLRLIESAADEDGTLRTFTGETDIFITPGYCFRFIDRLLTNFHLPRSTLFMLVAAFSGLETMKRAYAHAVEDHYRFYSYGDACLLSPADCA